GSAGLWKRLQQGLSLLSAEAAHAPGLADSDLLHQAASPHLADARKGLEQRDNLHLADHLIAVGLLEQLLETGGAHLQLLPQLSAAAASGGGFVERGLTLVGRQRGREGHGVGHYFAVLRRQPAIKQFVALVNPSRT